MSKAILVNEYSDKKMSATEAAYVAGMLDGEGSVGMTKEKRSWGFSYSPRCDLACGTNLNHMLAIRQKAGNGRIGVEQKGSNKPLYSLTLQRAQMKHVLPQLLPYVILKREQIQLVLRCMSLMGERQRQSSMDMESIEDIAVRLAVLNKRGGDNSDAVTVMLQFRKNRVRPVLSCSVEGCKAKYFGHGYCKHHYWYNIQRANNPLVEIPCPECGNPFLPTGTKKCCSHDCYQKWYYKNVAKPKSYPSSVFCLECGGEVKTANRKKFCSERCAQHYRRKQSRPVKETRLCRTCGVEIDPLSRRTVYCSQTCKRKGDHLPRE